MGFYKKREDANYLSDSEHKYLFADDIIIEFCQHKYDCKRLVINLSLITFFMNGGIKDLLSEKHFDEFAKVNPNLIIYSKSYAEPTRNNFKRDYKLRDTIEIYVRLDDKVWMPLVEGEYSGVAYYKLYWVLNEIENDMESDYKHGDWQNTNSIGIYAINVPDVDLAITELTAKLIENKIEII